MTSWRCDFVRDTLLVATNDELIELRGTGQTTQGHGPSSARRIGNCSASESGAFGAKHPHFRCLVGSSLSLSRDRSPAEPPHNIPALISVCFIRPVPAD